MAKKQNNKTDTKKTTNETKKIDSAVMAPAAAEFIAEVASISENKELPYRCWVPSGKKDEKYCPERFKTEKQLLAHYKKAHPDVLINENENGTFDVVINGTTCKTHALKKDLPNGGKAKTEKAKVEAGPKPESKAGKVHPGKPQQTDFMFGEIRWRVYFDEKAKGKQWHLVESKFTKLNPTGRKEYGLPGFIRESFKTEAQADKAFMAKVAEISVTLVK